MCSLSLFPARPEEAPPWHPYRAAALMAVLTFPALLLDLPVGRLSAEGLGPPELRRVLAWSEVFAHGLGVAIIAGAVWVLDPSRRRQVPRLLASAYLAGLLANLGKLAVARLRPRCFSFQGGVAETFVGWLPLLWGTSSGVPSGSSMQSFPSGHAATAVGLAVALTRMYPRGRWLFPLMALAAALQRIDTGAHFVSDTVAAAALGLLAAGWVGDPRGLGRFFDRLEGRASIAGTAPPTLD